MFPWALNRHYWLKHWSGKRQGWIWEILLVVPSDPVGRGVGNSRSFGLLCHQHPLLWHRSFGLSLLNMNAGRKKGPICKIPFPIAASSDPFLADFRLANACPLGLDMATLVNTCACSCLTSICDAPESTSMVALLCVFWPMCIATCSDVK